MICPICSQEIGDDSKFCGKCGSKIPRCPTCGKVITRRARFCINDGTLIPEDILNLLPNENKPPKPVGPGADAAGETGVRDTAALNAEPGSVDKNDAAAIMEALTAADLTAEREPKPEPPAGQDPPDLTSAQHPDGMIEDMPVRKRFCLQCGTPCEDGATLCPDCRARMSPASPQTPKKIVPPAHRFCVKCGKPCEEGQILCPACLRMEAIGSFEPEAPVKRKKKPLTIILIIIIILLLLLCIGLAGYFVLNGFASSGGSNDVTATNEASEEESIIDRTGIEDDLSAAEEDAEQEAAGSEVSELPGKTEPETEPETEPSEVPEYAEEPETPEPEEPEPEVLYEHTYEIIPGDLSWQEAKSACEAKGGHLATITSQEEYEEISRLATASGLTYLWLGASLNSDSDEWANDSWLTGESWTFENWYPGEPSKEDTDGTKEYYLCIWNAKYDDKEIGWTFNDQRNDIVEAFPSIAGKVGYICEYEIEVSR